MLTIKVTRIGNIWHARLLSDGKVIDEMACKMRSDIGWICREMLRWQDKLGYHGTDWQFASAARHRQVTGNPAGRVWNCFHLNNKR